MQVEIKGNKIIITLDANTKNPPPSSSGKTLLVASTHGGVDSGVKVNDKPLKLNVSAYIKAN